MTGTAPATPAGQPGRDDLTPRIFRALYAEFDLRVIGATYVVTPVGVPCVTGHSLGEIARQISEPKEPGHDRQPDIR